MRAMRVDQNCTVLGQNIEMEGVKKLHKEEAQSQW